MKALRLGACIALLIIIASSHANAQVDEDLGVEPPLCHDTVVATGGELGTRERARRSADDAWMSSVRFDYGERYHDLNNAKDVSHVCIASSVAGESAFTSRFIVRTLFRCMVVAKPCQTPSTAIEHVPPTLFEETASSKPLLRRVIEEEPEPSTQPAPESPARSVPQPPAAPAPEPSTRPEAQQ
jgi:hypothetical protein